MSDQPDRSVFGAEHLAARDDIAASALGGELDAAASAHLDRCAECTSDLAAYRRVTAVGRAAAAAEDADEMPPQAVWQRIALAVGFDADPNRISTVLEAGPDAPPGARAVARVGAHETGRLLSVDASGLPAAHDYYAVWLADPDQHDLVAMGTLGPEQTGVWTIPPGLELSSYPVVVVSVQRYGGVPTPGPVVLRGAFAH